MSLARLHFTPGAHGVVCVPRTGHDESVQAEAERIDAMESWPGPSCRSPTPSAISTAEVYREHPDVLLDLTFDVWGQKHLIDAGLLAAGDLDWLSNVDARPGRARSTRTPAASTTRTYQAQQRGLPEEDGRE